jgi:hypothetical protein
LKTVLKSIKDWVSNHKRLTVIPLSLVMVSALIFSIIFNTVSVHAMGMVSVKGQMIVLSAPTAVDYQVSGTTDDADYYISVGTWTFATNHQYFNSIGEYDANNTRFGQAMRFISVAVPQGAIITSAYLSFQSQSSVGTAVQSKIYGQAVDDAATFSTEADFKNRWGVNGGTDARTTASVDWDNFGAWSLASWYNSPDIKAIVQEITDRAGWATGNDMAFTWNDWADESANNNYRATFFRDFGSANAPKLHIEYTVPNISNNVSTKDFGVVLPSTTYYAKGSAPDNPVVDGNCTYILTNNNADSAVKVNIKCSNATGGTGWTLTSDAVGQNTYKAIAYKTGDNPTGVTLTTSDQVFCSSIASSGHIHWDFQMQTGTFTDGAQKTYVITLTGVKP